MVLFILMKVLQIIKPVDKEKERSGRIRSIHEFVASYNQNLPSRFPQATLAQAKEFQKAFPTLFNDGRDSWSLERHRKKMMDWLPRQ